MKIEKVNDLVIIGKNYLKWINTKSEHLDDNVDAMGYTVTVSIDCCT